MRDRHRETANDSLPSRPPLGNRNCAHWHCRRRRRVVRHLRSRHVASCAARVVIGAVEAIFDFFKTPVGQVLGIIMLCALFCVIGVVHTAKVYEVKIVALNAAHQRDIDGLNSAWQVESGLQVRAQGVDEAGAKFKQDRKDRDDDVDTEVSAKVAAATADLTAHADKLQAEVNAYAKLPHQKCVLGPADLDDGVRAPGH